VLRRADRILAPVTWVAAALTVLLLFIGPSLIGAEADKTAAQSDETATQSAAAAPDGKEIFTSKCAGCHTLARADATGNVGPNLDDAKPDAATVKSVVTNGKGTMPAFSGDLSGAEIDAVAAFVAGEEPAAAESEETASPKPEPEETAAPKPGAVTTVRTDRGPDGITVAGDRVWVANATAGTLQRFDAATGRAQGAPLAVGSQPDNPVVTDGVVWVALSGQNAVAKVEGTRVTRIAVGRAPEDLAVAGDHIWVTNAGDGTVTRIDRASGKVDGRPIRVGRRPLGIAATQDSLWVSSYDDGTVWRLDAATGKRRGAPIRVGSRPRGVAADGDSAWVANSGDDTVTRLDDSRTVDVGRNPRDLVVSGDLVWVANAADDTVTRIDGAAAKAVGDPIKVGDDPIGIAAGRAVWTSNFRDDTLTRSPIG
jgi:DNA-binding beta-propeller fold protein YncE/mono/diheme cytochrome c family protein